MKHRIVLAIFSLLSVLAVPTYASPYNDFWEWFKTNEGMIYDFEKDQEETFDQLAVALAKINPDLTFEFGPILSNKKREFVISAGGIKASFGSVEALVDSAPKLDKWILVKYRQRRTSLNDLSINGVSVKASDVFYNLYKDGEKLGVILFFDSYTEADHSLYAHLGFLFLDESLGEFDVATKIGFIELRNKKSQYFSGARPLKELSNQVDNYYAIN